MDLNYLMVKCYPLKGCLWSCVHATQGPRRHVVVSVYGSASGSSERTNHSPLRERRTINKALVVLEAISWNDLLYIVIQDVLLFLSLDSLQWTCLRWSVSSVSLLGWLWTLRMWLVPRPSLSSSRIICVTCWNNQQRPDQPCSNQVGL